MNKIVEPPEPAVERIEFAENGENSIYERLREEIIEGKFQAGARLKVNELANRMGTSTNPVREALQQLRGEGFVVLTPNCGARVRPIDEEFIRDTFEIAALIEPALTQWFVGVATNQDIAALEAVQGRIEEENFMNRAVHSDLDSQFHRIMYNRHYNRHAVDLWWRHREILKTVGRRFPVSLSRQKNIFQEHRDLIACIKAQDAEQAARVIRQHAEGAGRHIIEHMRLARLG